MSGFKKVGGWGEVMWGGTKKRNMLASDLWTRLVPSGAGGWQPKGCKCWPCVLPEYSEHHCLLLPAKSSTLSLLLCPRLPLTSRPIYIRFHKKYTHTRPAQRYTYTGRPIMIMGHHQGHLPVAEGESFTAICMSRHKWWKPLWFFISFDKKAFAVKDWTFRWWWC